MLFLQLQIGDEAYALAATGVVEILPLVELKAARGAPAGVAGTFDYRGRYVPVVDLCLLELGRPASRRLGTRIVMVRIDGDGDVDAAADPALVGLIAENVTDIMRREPADFAPFAQGPRGLTQRVEPADLLPAHLRAFVLHAARPVS